MLEPPAAVGWEPPAPATATTVAAADAAATNITTVTAASAQDEDPLLDAETLAFIKVRTPQARPSLALSAHPRPRRFVYPCPSLSPFPFFFFFFKVFHARHPHPPPRSPLLTPRRPPMDAHGARAAFASFIDRVNTTISTPRHATPCLIVSYRFTHPAPLPLPTLPVTAPTARATGRGGA